MANSTWNGSNDNWNTAGDWTGGVLPGTADDVVITSGTPLITSNVGTVATVTESAGLSLQNGGALATTGAFHNAGTLGVDQNNGAGGSSLTIGGVLTNTNTINLGNPYGVTAPTTITAQGLANTGTINIASNNATTLAKLNVTSAAGFGTTGVLTGNVNLTNDSLLEFASGQISSIAVNSELSLSGANAVVADAGALTSNSALAGLTANAGGLYLYNGNSITTTGAFNNTGTLGVDQNNGTGGSSLTIGGVLTNTNTINLGEPYGVTAPTSITAQGLANTGTINIWSSNATTLAKLNIGGAAGFGTTGVLTGSVNLTNDSLLEFASGQITSIAVNSELSLSGANAVVADAGALTSNSALTGLTSNAGGLYLYNGNSITTTSAFNNTGTLGVDQNNGTGGSSLTIGGVLTNTNTINLGEPYGVTAPTSITAQGLANTGTINIWSSNATTLAKLNVTSAAGFGTTGVLTGSVNLTNDSLLEFASGQISSIAVNSELSLSGANAVVADAGALTSNSALTGLTANAGGLYLYNGNSITTTSAFNNTGTLGVDQNNGTGGSSLTIGGVLTNTNTINLGEPYGVTAPTSITAQGLANTGTINIWSSNATTLAKLNVTSAAGFGTTGVLTGNVNLTNESLLEFASGQISSIAVNSELSLSGANAVVADAGALTSNSALSGLTSNAGGLYLYNGNSITTTSAFNNTGTLGVDQNNGTGGSSLTIGGVLTNTNTINLGEPYGVTAPTSITAQGLANTGTINIWSSNATTLAKLNIGGAAGFGTTGVLTGSVNLTNDSLLEFASGQITSIAVNSELSLSGANAVVADAGALTSNSALTGLASNAGGLYLYNGNSITTTSAFNNTGTLGVDQNNGTGGSSLTIGGVLTNTNTINLGEPYGVTAPTSITAQGLANSGTINIWSSNATTLAKLNINGAAGFGATGVLTGNVNLVNDALLQFANGQIASIAGALVEIGANAQVDDIGGTGANSALTGLTNISGQLLLQSGSTIATTTDLTNTGVINLDSFGNGGQGGSSLSVGGTLTNRGAIAMGGLGAGMDSITAKGLVNKSTIDIYGSPTLQSSLVVDGDVSNNAGYIAVNAGFQGSNGVPIDSAFQVNGNYTQSGSANLTLGLLGVSAGQFATLGATGAVDIAGGTLSANPQNGFAFAAGQTFNLETFASGKLSGIYDTLHLGNAAGASTNVSLSGGLIAGLVYDDALGNVKLQIATAPTSTAETWTSGAGDWGTAADWSNGAPRFYSDVAIGAAVTLSHDATIDSVSLGAGGSLTTAVGTDLSIGTTLTTAAGAALTIGGEAFVDAGAAVNGAVTVNGLLDIRGVVTGTGGFTLGAGAELELGGADSETVTFNGAGAILKLDHPTSFTGTLANLAVGDIIDLAGITVAAPTVTGGTTLSFSDASSNNYSYTLSGFPGGAGFVAQSDGNGGTELIVTPPASSVTLDPVEGTNTINHAQAAAGVTVGGAVTGLAAGATFALNVIDGAVSMSYVATVGASGATWTASIPASDLAGFPDGSASFAAVVNSTTQAAQTVVIHETPPVVTLARIDGNNVINHAQAQAGVGVSGGSTGLIAGATISVSVTDASVTRTYSATVGGGGGWTTTIPSADALGLANGTATVAAQGSDAYGNVSALATQSVTVQESSPTLTLDAVDGDNVINHAQALAGVTLSGGSTGLPPGATFTVTVSDAGFSKGYLATVGSGGAWTATLPPADATTLGNGAATVSAQAFDAAGNGSALVSETVTVAGNVPTLTISTVAGDNVINGAEAAAGVTISGTSTGLAAGATFNVGVVDGLFSKAYLATVSGGGAWSASIPASDATSLNTGTAVITAQASDAYGNVSAVATQTVGVHETLPTLTISTVAGDNVINSAEAAAGVTISGTSTGLAAGATFNVGVVDGLFSKAYLATVSGGGAWSASIPASDATSLNTGTAVITAQASDAYGNVSAVATQTVGVHETLPTLTISTVAGDNVINSAEAAAGVTISGTSTGLAAGATFNVGVVDGLFSKTYLATVASGGAWSASIPSSDATTLNTGTAVISAQASDAYGNVSAVATQTVGVHETLPTLTISTVAGDNVINSVEAAAGVTISGTSTGLAAGATFNVGVVDGLFSKTYLATVSSGGAWSASIPSGDALALPSGAANVSVQATDAFGNVSALVSQSVAVQTSASVTLDPVDGDNVINYAEAHASGGVTLSGSVSGLASGATFGVSVVDGVFNKTYTATVGANGVWSASVPMTDAAALVDGSAVVTATVAPGVSVSENVVIAETRPVFTALADTPDTGDLDAGHLVTLTLTASQAIAVNGAPTLSLNDGETASFDAAKSTATSLVFDYTVQAGDNTPALRATAVNLNGATLLDAAGNAALLSIGGLAQKGPQIDTRAPVFVGLVETPNTGMVGIGRVVTLYLFASEAVTVAGAPMLTLNDGGTATFYAAGSNSTRLAFRTTIAAGQSSPNLQATALSLNGGGVFDLAGNPANLSLANLTEAGPAVSGIAPVIAAVAETPATGDLNAGKTVVFSLTVSEAVTVTGTPRLTLNDGGLAIYDAVHSTATSLAFNYTVAAGQNTAALAATALGGGAIRDAYGNSLNPSLAGLTQTGPKIDTLASKFTAVTETPATGDLDTGKTVALTLTVNEAVVVSGTPTLTLNDGGTATFDAAHSSATSLVFDYTVAATQNTAALKATGVNLAGGSILDLAGNIANLSLAGLTQAGPQIDTLAPKFTAVTQTPATGDLDAGKTVTLTLKTSEAVVVSGAPTLTLNDGGTATFSGATATSLVFNYTVAAGQNTAALKATAVNLAGGGVFDLAGNAANLSLTGLAQAGPKIDTTAPTFTAVAETPATGDLNAGKTVAITLTASEAVAVSGAPTLALNDGAIATYDAARSSATSLVFDYTVAPGQNIPALAVSTINLNGGAIDDLAGNVATLSLTGLTQSGPQIDTKAPTVVSAAGSPSSGDLLTGQTEAITLTLSEAAKATGAPSLVLSDGGLATYASGSGTNALTFNYHVLAGQQSSDLQIVGSSFGAGSGIVDLAGNPLLLPRGSLDLGVGVNNFVTLTGSDVYQIAGPSNKDVVFAPGASADLILTDSQHYTGHLSGLGTADTLDLADLSYNPLTSASFAGTTAGGTLTVNDGAHQAAISLLGNFTNSTFTLSNDGYGGVNIVDPLRSSLAAHVAA